MHIDLDIVFYAVVAVALIARLWSVLGTRNEDEPQRPNPFVPPQPKPDANDASFNAPPPSPLLQPLLAPASVAGGLAQIKTLDASFDERQFLQDMRSIFTHVVEAYATGDLETIASLTSPDLLTHFQKAVEMRRSQGQTAQTRVLNIKDAETVAASIEDTQALITVQLVSVQENILRDARGTVIGGSEGASEEVTDRWTFMRDASVADGKWIVVRTGA